MQRLTTSLCRNRRIKKGGKGRGVAMGGGKEGLIQSRGHRAGSGKREWGGLCTHAFPERERIERARKAWKHIVNTSASNAGVRGE